MNKKKRMPSRSYILWLLLIIALAATLAVSAYTIFITNQYKSEIKQYRTYISELNTYLLNSSTELADEQVPAIVIEMPENKYISNPESVDINFADAVAILQTQQEQYNNHVNVMFAILSIVITAVTIVIPIFNYAFLQKEHIEKIQMISDNLDAQNETYSSIISEHEQHFEVFAQDLNEQYEFLQKLMEQSQELVDETVLHQNEYENLTRKLEAELRSQRHEYQSLIQELKKEIAKANGNFSILLGKLDENTTENIEETLPTTPSKPDLSEENHNTLPKTEPDPFDNAN